MGREDADILYDVLSAERRRRALSVLVEADEPLDREEVVRRLVARRSTDDRRGSDPTVARPTKVGISLKHVHLPKLEDGGVVERTVEGEYAATPLGRDVERAARAFEARLGVGARTVADGPR